MISVPIRLCFLHELNQRKAALGLALLMLWYPIMTNLCIIVENM